MLAARACSNSRVLQLPTAQEMSPPTNPTSLPPIVSVTRSALARSALSSCVSRSCVWPASTCGTPPRLFGSTFFVFAPEHAHDAQPTPPPKRTFLSEPYLFLPVRIPGRPPPDAIAYSELGSPGRLHPRRVRAGRAVAAVVDRALRTRGGIETVPEVRVHPLTGGERVTQGHRRERPSVRPRSGPGRRCRPRHGDEDCENRYR